jgi:hypothetical protein
MQMTHPFGPGITCVEAIGDWYRLQREQDDVLARVREDGTCIVLAETATMHYAHPEDWGLGKHPINQVSYSVKALGKTSMPEPRALTPTEVFAELKEEKS